MNTRPCMFSECDEPPVKALTVTVNGQDYRFGCCAEHAHDIDWGVLDPAPTFRGLLSTEPDGPEQAD